MLPSTRRVTKCSSIMGQNQSKRLSTNSATPLNPTSNTNAPEPEIAGPAPPPTIYRLSELFDPADLVQEERQALSDPSYPFPPGSSLPRRPFVQSPSGRVLDVEQLARHANRPLSLRERQEEIMRRTLAAVERAETPGGDEAFAEGHDSQTGSATQETEQRRKKKKRRGCCGYC